MRKRRFFTLYDGSLPVTVCEDTLPTTDADGLQVPLHGPEGIDGHLFLHWEYGWRTPLAQPVTFSAFDRVDDRMDNPMRRAWLALTDEQRGAVIRRAILLSIRGTAMIPGGKARCRCVEEGGPVS